MTFWTILGQVALVVLAIVLICLVGSAICEAIGRTVSQKYGNRK